MTATMSPFRPLPHRAARSAARFAAAAATLCLWAATATAQVIVTPLSPSAPPAPPLSIPGQPFHERVVTLDNGIVGRALSFISANPQHYEDIVQKRAMPAVTLHAKLFVPRGATKAPAVIIAPGSGGVNPWMLVHAKALTDSGIAVLLVDPFGGRGVRDTIAAQGQFSFAASTWDVFAAMRALEREPDIDTTRLGAMGYSRGGISVLQAAVRPLAEAALGPGKALRAVVAGWPWCGFQFADPQTAPTAVRFAVADSDNWVSPLQCQAYFNAMKPRNPAVSFRLFRDASHGFGYGTAVRDIPQAVHALNAPIIYFDPRGVAQDPWTGDPMPGAGDGAIESMARSFLGRGVRAGTQGDQMQDFIRDFVGFFITYLKL
jgi:dienelactone hydrolase